MKKALYFLGIISLFSCSVDQESEENINFYSAYPESEVIVQDGIEYNGNFIFIEEFEEDDTTYVVQEINKIAGDLNFSATQVPRKLYLQNQGVSGDDLDVALEETKGELIYYFEIEGRQKTKFLDQYCMNNSAEFMSYLSFDLYKDFILTDCNGNEFKADYSIYEQSSGVRPFEKFIVVFTEMDESQNYSLLYQDQLFGKGKSEYNFAPQNIIDSNQKNPA